MPEEEQYLVLDFRTRGEVFSFTAGKERLNEWLKSWEPTVLGRVDFDHSGSLNMVNEGPRGVLIFRLRDIVIPQGDTGQLSDCIAELLIQAPHDQARAFTEPYCYCRWCKAHRLLKQPQVS